MKGSAVEAASADEPLRQSEAMADLSKKLGLLERVRHVCQAVQISLPGIVVVGEQSAGKSSLLENISGIQFPRAQNTCTRMPCILTMLTDPSASTAYAQVSMDPSFADVNQCSIVDVEEKIRSLTEQHAKDISFISRDAIYVRVVRNDGPQLSLIDLPGVTHNAEQMKNIHDVTVGLVEEYVKSAEVVILCVIPATSDFGNAEVVKLAHKYDPDGKRTLGVVTKCDDAARAEASDIVEKALMRRKSDVKLKLGFHCVVNRSQKNIEDGMSCTELWQKENHLFESNDVLKMLPSDVWGTPRLMEKIANIQASRVDECLPKIKDAVRLRLVSLREELRALPAQVESEADQYRLFNGILRQVNDDLQRRVRAEFMSSDSRDKDFAIAPKIAGFVQEFRSRLIDENPEWLGEEMLTEVTDTVEHFVRGYTVDNLTGPQVFTNMIKRTFVEYGMLKNATDELVEAVASHLRCVVTQVVNMHADVNAVFASRLIEKAHDVIDERLEVSQQFCNALAEAQQVTSTTNGSYMVKLTDFRKSWFEQAAASAQNVLGSLMGASAGATEDVELPSEFLDVIKNAQQHPEKLAVLEICASLHVYTHFLIEGFVEMSTKFVKFNMVEKLAEKLEDCWRADLAGSTLKDLFPKDNKVARQRVDLTDKMNKLQEFKEQLTLLRISAPQSEVVSTQAKRRKDDIDSAQRKFAQKRSKGAQVVGATPLTTYTWDVSKMCNSDHTFQNGEFRTSPEFTKFNIPGMKLKFYPQGEKEDSKGSCSLYLFAPKGWQIRYRLFVDDFSREVSLCQFGDQIGRGYEKLCDARMQYSVVGVEVLEAIPSKE